jgi:beta propeller repeat protein
VDWVPARVRQCFSSLVSPVRGYAPLDPATSVLCNITSGINACTTGLFVLHCYTFISNQQFPRQSVHGLLTRHETKEEAEKGMENRVTRLSSGCFFSMTCAVLLLMLPVMAGAATLTGTEQRVTTAPADQFDPAISGDLVVYTDFSGVDADVWYTDLKTGTAHPVSTAPGDQQLTGVSDNRIVFTDWNTMDVLVFDVTAGVTTNLTNGAGSNSLDPAIGHNLVAWTDDRDGNAEIYAKDLSTGEERRITNDLLVDEAPSVGDGIIAWERCDGYACDVFVYEWATGTTKQLTATPWASERFPDVRGRTVVFQREQGTPIDKDIVAYDLDTQTERVLALPGDQENAHISGDFVAFNDSASGVPHIGLWRLSADDHFTVTDNVSGQYLNDIDGNRIVYSDNRAGTLDIYMYTFSVEDEKEYVFGGFQQPINANGSSIFKLGRTIPVKIVLTDSNGQNVPSAVVTLSVSRITDAILGTETEVLLDASGNANTGNLFRYDASSGQYIYNLNTKGYAKGTYRLYARPDDGKSYSVDFSLK